MWKIVYLFGFQIFIVRLNKTILLTTNILKNEHNPGQNVICDFFMFLTAFLYNPVSKPHFTNQFSKQY